MSRSGRHGFLLGWMGRSPRFGSVVLVIVVAIGALACGCTGKPRPVSVSGKVFYNDKPLPFGVVMFQPERGQLGVGEIQEEGFFRLSSYAIDDGVIPGKHRVCVTCFEGQRPRKDSPGPGGGTASGELLIPRKYTEFGTSGLTAEVKESGEQTFEFRLKGPPLKN